jgi:hypothetical protein
MNRIFKKALAGVTSVGMIFALSPVTICAEGEKWQIDKSKTATELNDKDQTTVTLSLPSAEITSVNADVVFVMDHSAYAEVDDIDSSVVSLLQELESKEGLTLNIGVISFDGWGVDAISNYTNGTTSGMLTLNDTNYDTILGAIKSGAKLGVGGSNSEQPIRMANSMLASDTRANTSKYMVVLSDFLTYVYEGSATVTNTDGSKSTYDHIPVGSASTGQDLSILEEWTQESEYNTWSSLKEIYDENNKTVPGSDWNDDTMFFRYGMYGSYDAAYSQRVWMNYRKTGGGAYDTDPTNEWQLQTRDQYNKNAAAVKASVANEKHITGWQRSSLLTYDAMESALDSGTHVIAYANTTDAWNKEMNYFPRDMLNAIADAGADVYQGGSKISAAFDNLKQQVTYLIGSGSVSDSIGTDFDLIKNGNCPFTLTVAGQTLEATSVGTNEWAFGTKSETTGLYPYSVKYTAGSDEKFVWTINVPVEKTKQTQLSYTLQLNTGKNGTYQTNGPTSLNYKDSNGVQHDAESFTSPTVTRNKKGTSDTSKNTVYVVPNTGVKE